MKRLSLYLFLIFFTLPTPSQADDIRDFEIEGISIGDSLLDYFSKNEINNAIEIYNYPGGNDYIYYFLRKPNSMSYEFIQVHVKPKDKNFIVYGIEGHNMYEKNINKCYNEMKNVEKILDDLFKIKSLKDSGKHPTDKSGKSTYKRIMYLFPNRDYAEVICYDMSKNLEEKGKYDRFVVSLAKQELLDFLTYKAYN